MTALPPPPPPAHAALAVLPLGLRVAPPATLGLRLERPRAIKALRDRMMANIVVLRAPPGFGKTYLMAEAHAALSGSAARAVWLTVRQGYLDADEFLAECAVALGQEAPAGRAEAAMLSAIDAAPGQIVLFLDMAEADMPVPVAEVLFHLVHARPDHLRVVLATRRMLRHPFLSRLMLQGALAELDWTALALDAAETDRMLTAGGLGGAAGAAVAGFADGWPAMVRLGLACVRPADAPLDPASEAAALETLLEGRFPPLQQFVESTVLPGLDPALGRALALSGLVDPLPEEMLRTDPFPADGAARTSEAAGATAPEEAEPLLRRLADRPGWFRPHPALAAAARQTELRLPEARRAARHARLAGWFASRRLLEQAVHHAVETRDFALAEGAIREAGGVRIFLTAGFPTLNRLLAQLPAAVILHSATLMLCKAVVCAKGGQIALAREMVEGVRASHNDGARMDALPEDLDHIDTLVATYEDRLTEPPILLRMERSLKSLAPHDLWRTGWMSNHLCIAYTILGRFDEAEAEALRSLASYREEAMRYAQVFILTHLALISVTKGQPLTALAFTDEAQGLISQGFQGDLNLRAVLAVPVAEAQWVRGEAEAAAKLLDEALPHLQKGEAWVDLLARAYHVRIRIALMRKESRAALRILDGAEQVARERRLDRLRRLVDLMRLEVMIASGLTEAAEEIARRIAPWIEGDLAGTGQDWANGKVLCDSDPPDTASAAGNWRERHLALQLLAQMLWSRSDPEGALVLLARLETRAQAIGAMHDVASARALRFSYLWQLRRFDQARETFQLTVALATPQRLASIFVSHSAEMAIAVRGLMRRFGASAFSHATIEFIDRVLEGGPKPHPEAGGIVAGVPVTLLLTEHEREILQLLDLGLSNKEIARRIDRSEATVKYHLRQVYGKLGVRTRTMALATARQSLLARRN
jgi:LuxR family transcriptional regulator, maltose regulon positive regulatory protein